MIRISLIFFYVIIFGLNSLAFEYSNQGMIILLDDSEYKNISYKIIATYKLKNPDVIEVNLDQFFTDIEGAVTDDLVRAVLQKASPIVVSKKLLLNFKNYLDVNNAIDILIDNSFLIKLKEFDEKDWVIKQVNDDIFILIYKDHINDVKKYIKYDDMNSIQLKDITLSFTERPAAREFLKILEEERIFKSKKEFKNQPTIPRWSFYLAGHGNFEKTIADMSINNFKNFLDFLTNKIHTNLLIINSCYAAGQNMDMVTKDQNAIMGKSFPFAIASVASTDAPTSTRNLKLDLLQQDTKKYANNFDYFIKNSKNDHIDIKDILNNMFIEYYNMDIRNQLQIRLPETQWFSFNDLKNIATINNVIALARSKNRILNLNKYFNKPNLKYLFLGTNNIKFPLLLEDNKNTFMGFASRISGNAIHYLNKIITPNHDYEHVLDWFLKVDMLDAKKIFVIDEIEAQNGIIKDVMIFNQAETVGFGQVAYFRYSYFTDSFNNHLFKKYREKIKDSPKEYDNYLKTMYGQEDIVDFEKLKNYGIFLDSYSRDDKAMIVDKVTTSEVKDMRDVFYILERSIENDNKFLLIKELEVKYDSYDWQDEIPNELRGKILKLKNIVLERVYRNAVIKYFTLDDKYYKSYNHILEENYMSKYQEIFDINKAPLKRDPKRIKFDFVSNKSQDLPLIITE